MKKTVSLLFLLTAFASGLRSDKLLPKHYELEQLLLVSAVGIDPTEEGDIKLTLAYTQPADSSAVALLSASGKTLSEAINNASSYAGRSIFLGHTRMVIVGSDIAKSGLTDIFDYLMRSYETRASAYAITAEGKASDLLSIPPNSGTDVLNELDTLIKSLSENSLAYPTNLGEMMAGFADDLMYPTTPLIRTMTDENGKPTVNALVGSAVYKDDRLLTTFTEENAFILTLLRNTSNSFSTVCDTPSAGRLSVRISSSEASTDFKKSNGRITAYVTLDLRAAVTESSLGGFGTKDLDELSKLLEEHFKESVEGFLARCQASGEDLAQFEDDVRRFHPVLYSQFDGFSGMDIHVDARCRIENSFVSNDR